MSKKAPRNTEQEAMENPEMLMLEAMCLGPEAASDRQQDLCQREMAGSNCLPVKFNNCDPNEAREALEKAGVEFIAPVEGDEEVFCYVTLPHGWRMESDGRYWSRLVDDRGRTRADIFYKADFHDREATISVRNRFSVKFDYDRRWNENIVVANVLDQGRVIFSTPLRQASPNPHETARLREASHEAAVKWLSKRYPHWENPAAYW